MSNYWENLDVEALLTRREEQTTSSGVGAYPVPLGRPLRATFPTSAKGYTSVDHPYLPRHESDTSDSDLLDYEWASQFVR